MDFGSINKNVVLESNWPTIKQMCYPSKDVKEHPNQTHGSLNSHRLEHFA